MNSSRLDVSCSPEGAGTGPKFRESVLSRVLSDAPQVLSDSGHVLSGRLQALDTVVHPAAVLPAEPSWWDGAASTWQQRTISRGQERVGPRLSAPTVYAPSGVNSVRRGSGLA